MSTLIAEIGWNHMGDRDLAESMIKAAKDSGATWAKFQTWSVSRLCSGEWDDDGRRQIYEKAELSLDDHRFLISSCSNAGIGFMSSVFSIPDADLLSSLGIKEVKIPSFEVANEELIKHCTNNFDRIIVSTGTATEQELERLMCIIDQERTVVLHCVSAYPCEIGKINLPRINLLREKFQNVGFSDHCSGINAAVISLEFKPCIIEKHFTIDHDLPGRDNKFAILPHEMKQLSNIISDYSLATANHGLAYQSHESSAREFYRGRFNKTNA